MPPTRASAPPRSPVTSAIGSARPEAPSPPELDGAAASPPGVAPVLGEGVTVRGAELVPRPAPPAAIVRGMVEQVTSAIGVGARVDLRESGEEITVTCTGGDLALLIGKHGQTIDALQYLANAAVFPFRPAARYISGQVFAVDGACEALRTLQVPYPQSVLDPDAVAHMIKPRL